MSTTRQRGIWMQASENIFWGRNIPFFDGRRIAPESACYKRGCLDATSRDTLPPMRRLMLLFLMLCLPLQLIHAAERGYAHAAGLDAHGELAVTHVLAHAEHMPHHHHDDGVTHLDDSQASTEHLLDCEKHCAMGLVLLSAYALRSFEPPHQATPTFRASYYPERTTSPPLRPPHAPA